LYLDTIRLQLRLQPAFHLLKYIVVARKLYRSTNDKMIAGICGGLGEYFDTDPVIFRILFVILALPGGLPGVIPYVIMWLLVPEKGNETTNG